MTTDATRRAAARPSWRHLGVLLAAGLLVSCAVMLFLSSSLVLPPIADHLGVGLGVVMVFASIQYVAAGLVMALGGTFLTGPTIGARRLVLFGAPFSAAMYYVVSYVNSVWMLYLLAALSGVLLLASTQMAATVLVSDWFHKGRGLALGVMQGIGGAGGIVAGTVLPPVIERGGWQAGFRVSAVVVAGIALVVGLFLVRSRPAELGLTPYGGEPTPLDAESTTTDLPTAEVITPAARNPLYSTAFVALLAAVLLINLVNAVQQHFATLLADNGLSLTAAGSLISILAVANIIATLGLGALVDRIGALATTVLGLGLWAASLVLFDLTTGYGWQLAAMLLIATAGPLAPVVAPIIVQQVFDPLAFTKLLGVILAAMPIGVAIGSPIWGLVHDRTDSYDLALRVSIGLLAVATVLFVRCLAGRPRT